MIEIFGDYKEKPDAYLEYLKLNFSPSSIPIQNRWRNNGLSADFLADYLLTFLPGDTDEAYERQAEIRDAVSYVANELLENAMKFNYAPEESPVTIVMHLEADNVRFYVTNGVDPATLAHFKNFIQKVLTQDSTLLQQEIMLRNAESDTFEGSGLGLVTMVQDYEAKVGWQFKHLPTLTVTTMVQLEL